jgi:hypothetical protein
MFDQFEDVLANAAYIMIVIGMVVFVISFLGSLQQNTFILTSYGLFLIIILALQVNISAKAELLFDLDSILVSIELEYTK